MFEPEYKTLRRAYGFDDVSLVPGDVTINPDQVDTTWKLGEHSFSIPFLAAAMDEGGERHAIPDDEGARARGPAQLVGRERHQIDAKESKIDGNLAERLDRIAMNECAVAGGKARDLGQRLNDPGFIVGKHNADQGRRTRQQAFECRKIDGSRGGHRRLNNGPRISINNLNIRKRQCPLRLLHIAILTRCDFSANIHDIQLLGWNE